MGGLIGARTTSTTMGSAQRGAVWLATRAVVVATVLDAVGGYEFDEYRRCVT